MALKGTIKDFGIADIFQLIGQQTKTGQLILRDDVDEIRVYFREGAVVRAESALIRAKLPSYAITLQKLTPLPAIKHEDDTGGDLGDMFGLMEDGSDAAPSTGEPAPEGDLGEALANALAAETSPLGQSSPP